MTLSGLHYLTNGCADNIHFGSGEAISARKIARRASRPYIALDVREGIVDAIKTSIFSCCSAVSTWHFDHRQNLHRGKVASINPLVSLAQESRPSALCLVPSPHTCFPRSLLLWRQVRPALFAPVAAFLSDAMAFPAFIRNAARSAFVCAKKLGGRRLLNFTSVTFSHVGTVTHPHTQGKDYP